MQKFISPICVNPTETQDRVFNVSNASEGIKHCARLVAEMCSEFDLQVVKSVKRHHRSHSSDYVHLVTKDNQLHAGYVYAEGTCADDMTYYYSCGIIAKEKSSAKSDRSTRDSSKIKTLMANLRKNNEIPTENTLIQQYKGGISCAFRAIANNNGNVYFNLNDKLGLLAVKSVLGVDTNISNDVRSQLQDVYDQYKKEVEAVKDMRDTQKRFAQGATFIGVIHSDHDDKVSYIVGKASYDLDKNEVVIHDTVKRYSTLVDSPIASTAVMLRTYLKNQPTSGRAAENELGVTNTDHYYGDIDLAVGYSNYREIFSLIPDIHE